MHTILQHPGGKMDLSSLHLKVLKCLTLDAKMSIVEITDKTGLTARRVRRLLEEIHESHAVRVTTDVELGAASDIPFLIRMTYDQSKTTPENLLRFLRETYSLPLWQTFMSASEPVAIALLAVDTLTELDEITRDVRNQDFIDTAKVTISTHHKYFEGIRRRTLLELVKDVQLY
jgi:DNA-binding Lrp family transcriptional regulator